MTQEREELLISDVAETKGMLNRFLKEWDERKPSIASCDEVDSVNERLTAHIAEGKHNAGLWPVWVAATISFFSLVVAGIALWGHK
jgi:hypothetical protein